MSRMSLLPVVVAVVVLVSAVPAVAAVDLRVAAGHDREPLLRAAGSNTTVYAGRLTLTVSNAGDVASSGVVTVTDSLPAGLSPLVNNPGFDAGPVAASGDGWSCVGTSCSRSDALAPGASYPPVTITVRVANGAPAQLTNVASVTGGATAGDVIAVAEDACPNGWSAEAEVTFAPPAGPGLHGGVRSGVTNPERADGCSLLDQIWAGEPFANHGAFVDRVDALTDAYTSAGLLTAAERDAVESGRRAFGRR
jgi:uncharacterized repeat protein (TIGR01451 family)